MREQGSGRRGKLLGARGEGRRRCDVLRAWFGEVRDEWRNCWWGTTGGWWVAGRDLRVECTARPRFTADHTIGRFA